MLLLLPLMLLWGYNEQAGFAALYEPFPDTPPDGASTADETPASMTNTPESPDRSTVG